MSYAHPHFEDIPALCETCGGPVEPSIHQGVGWYYCPSCQRERPAKQREYL